MTLRALQPSDHPAVNALHRAVWWPERSAAGWRWLDANPARTDIAAPSGWVVEGEDGHPAAFIGNMVQRVWQGDRIQHAATGFSLIVPPAARGRSRALIRSVIDQPHVFAVHTLNANPKSAPLYARHGMTAWPDRTSALKLSWVIDPIDCLHSRVLREMVRRAPGLTDPYRERFMSRRLSPSGLNASGLNASGLNASGMGSPRRRMMPSDIETLSDLGDASDYADFWAALKVEGRMVSDRSPQILRWRLSDPDQTRKPILLAHRREGRITGYGLAILAKATPIEPVVLEIVDLIALDDQPRAIPALMRGLMDAGRTAGAAKVRLQVVNEELLRRLGPWAAGARREGGWGHGHAVFRAGGPDPDSWQPTPFDGDHGICQRPLPIRPSHRATGIRPAA
ncbi:hypothetical protein BH10PSE2_BH10PSE2_22500 [soil metagenome]